MDVLFLCLELQAVLYPNDVFLKQRCPESGSCPVKGRTPSGDEYRSFDGMVWSGNDCSLPPRWTPYPHFPSLGTAYS
jgi:hypothetical protein